MTSQGTDRERDLETLNLRLADLLERTANALKGSPGPRALHDWSDLPQCAARLRTERDLLHQQVVRLLAQRGKWDKFRG